VPGPGGKRWSDEEVIVQLKGEVTMWRRRAKVAETELAKPKRPKRYRTTAQYLSSLRSMIRAAGPRVGAADPEDLAALLALHRAIEDAAVVAVRGKDDGWGLKDSFSWQSIGDALGITRQAALQRWGHRIDPE
jgi:hypothetical protein